MKSSGDHALSLQTKEASQEAIVNGVSDKRSEEAVVVTFDAERRPHFFFGDEYHFSTKHVATGDFSY